MFQTTGNLIDLTSDRPVQTLDLRTGLQVHDSMTKQIQRLFPDLLRIMPSLQHLILVQCIPNGIQFLHQFMCIRSNLLFIVPFGQGSRFEHLKNKYRMMTFLMVAFHSRTVQLMHTPPEALADTEAYLWICSLGIPFIIGYNVVCGILRGLGDSRTPLYFVALACALNIVMDFILVGGCHLRAAGAAIATVASQGVSFATALWYLYRKGFHFEFTRRDIRLDGQLCRRVLLLGAPIALQDLLVNFSFLLITVIVNGMGVVASAALGVVEKLIVFAMLPPMAISSAVAAMTAQNYGAGLRVRMNRCLYAGIGMALVFGVSVCLYSQFLPDTLTGIFTRDSEVVQMASGYLRGYSIDCIMVSFVFCINAYFSGQGNSVFPMVHSVISTFLFRIPLSYGFSLVSSSSLFLMGFAPPLSTLVSLMICIGYMRYKRKKEIIPVYA